MPAVPELERKMVYIQPTDLRQEYKTSQLLPPHQASQDQVQCQIQQVFTYRTPAMLNHYEMEN